MKRKLNFNLIVSILLLLISLAMAGLFSWARAGFRPDPLGDDKFWFSLIISTIINLFSLLSAISYDLPEQLEHNQDVKEKRKALLEINLTADATKLEEFAIELNLQRKKIVYLKDLEMKRKAYVKKYKPNIVDRKIWLQGSKEEKENNNYCIKLLEFDFLKSDQYLKDNLLYLDIDYPEVTATMIVSENMSRENGLSFVYTQREKSKWWFLQVFPRYVFGMLLSLAWASFFIEMTDTVDSLFWLDFSVRVVSMLINLASGFYVVKAYIYKIIIGDMDFRLSLARQFYIWLKNNDKTAIKS
jgi:hypothetical protein